MPTLAIQITVTHQQSGVAVHSQAFTIPNVNAARATQIRAIADRAVTEAQAQAGAAGARTGTLFTLRFQGQFNGVSVADTIVADVKIHRLGLVPSLLDDVWQTFLG